MQHFFRFRFRHFELQANLTSDMTHLISCPVPKMRVGADPPLAVTLSSTKCGGSKHIIKVTNERVGEKEKIAVCVKPLDFLDFDVSKRLAEWIEYQLLLGAHKVRLFYLDIL